MSGTCLRYMVSGWCLAGMRKSMTRSMNCMPRRVLTPMNMRTPYSTGMGMYFRMGASFTDSPVRMNTHTPVTRCSRTPTNCGVSPGAADSLST